MPTNSKMIKIRTITPIPMYITPPSRAVSQEGLYLSGATRETLRASRPSGARSGRFVVGFLVARS
jgi:hypothetical protein